MEVKLNVQLQLLSYSSSLLSVSFYPHSIFCAGTHIAGLSLVRKHCCQHESQGGGQRERHSSLSNALQTNKSCQALLPLSQYLTVIFRSPLIFTFEKIPYRGSISSLAWCALRKEDTLELWRIGVIRKKCGEPDASLQIPALGSPGTSQATGSICSSSSNRSP